MEAGQEPDGPIGEVLVGHWTAPGAVTGCTAVLLPEGSVASGEVRGGAPATREFALLDPRRMVENVDAVVLAGGSAFGLSCADGVQRVLVERERGFVTRAGRVPIVVAMGLFDLAEGAPRPGPAEGELAARAAVSAPIDTGRVGAGAGATIGKWRGPEYRTPAGIGRATVRSAELEVTALVAVNAVGDIDDGATVAEVVAGDHVAPAPPEQAFENTTIGVIWTNARLSKLECRLVAESGHDGLARALVPAHTSGDGDALVAASVGTVDAAMPTVRLLATVAVDQAIRRCHGG